MAESTPDSASFETFFAGSKAVDKNGRPLRLYHGTVNDFSVFDSSRSNVDGYFGAGFYFSSDATDVAANYATTEGSDFAARYTSEVEARTDDSETDPDLTVDEINAEVLARMAQNSGTTMPVYLAIKNPFIIGSANDSYLEFCDGFDGQGEFGVKTGRLQRFIEELKWVMEGYNAEREFDDLLAALQEEDLIQAPGISGATLINEVNRLIEPCISNFDDKPVISEMVRETIERCGFDGIIDHTVYEQFGIKKDGYGHKVPGLPGMSQDTVHYIVFKPAQVKSSIGNNGDFDVANPDIRFSMVDLDEYDADSDTKAPCQ